MHNSERMAQTIFGVPFHAFLTEEDVRYVGETLEKILESAAVRAA